MEQNAKNLLKLISEKVSTLTKKKISQVAHAPKENEWRAFISQAKPHWEDIAWRVKEPNSRGEAEVHLGFYSAKPSEELAQAIAKAEELAKGKVNHVIKSENGIRLVWQVDLNNQQNIDVLQDKIFSILSVFMDTALDAVCFNANNQNGINDSAENNNNGLNNNSLSDIQLEFLETKSSWNKEDLPLDWANSREFIIEAVKKDGRWIEIAPDTIKNDIEIVSLALTQDGSALEFVSEEMKSNKDVVLMAVSEDGNALEYAIDSLKTDHEIVLKAVSQNFYALTHVNANILENLNFVNQLLVAINKDKYKELFFKLSPAMRIEKNVMEAISPVYSNTNYWNDAKCSQSFLDYLSYFDSQNPFRNVDNLLDFTDEYEIPLSVNHFESLRDEVEILIFEIDNSDHAWEELGGSERFSVIYDLHKNVLLPQKKQSPNEDDLILIKKYQHLNSMHVGIYDPYHDSQTFDGCFSVSNYFEKINKPENAFNIFFHGDELEAGSEGNPDIFQKLRTAITPKAMYHFVSDVMSKF